MTSCHYNCQWERIQYAQCSSSRAAIGWWRAACGSKAGGRSLISTIALSCGAHCASSVSSADVHFQSLPRGLKPSANFIQPISLRRHTAFQRALISRVARSPEFYGRSRISDPFSRLPGGGGKPPGRTNLPYSLSQIVASLRRHCDT